MTPQSDYHTIVSRDWQHAADQAEDCHSIEELEEYLADLEVSLQLEKDE